MSRQATEVYEAAQKLSLRERAELVSRLLADIDGDPDHDAEALWAAELERRAQRVHAGEGVFEDWDIVRKRLRPGS